MDLMTLLGASGVAAGFLAGLFGVGGGLVMVPVLLYAFSSHGLPREHLVALAVGTSMAAIVVAAAQSARGHWRRGGVDLATLRQATPWVVLGVLAGATLASSASGRLLLLSVGAFQLLSAGLMMFDAARLGAVQAFATRPGALRTASVVFGAIAATAGIGGGTLFTPFLRASGMDTRQAIGTSAALGLPVSIAGAASYARAGYGLDLGGWTLGYVHLPALLALVLGSVLTVRLGVAAAHQLDARALSRAFAVFLVLNGARLMASAL